MKRWLRKLLVLLVSVAASLTVLEVLLRLFFPLPVHDYRQLYEAGIHYRMAPHRVMVEVQPEFKTEIRINNMGFRDDDFRQERTPGVPRIAVLGDSFTFGTGVQKDQTAVELLEKSLAEAGIPCEVLNFGLPGADTWKELAVLRHAVIPHRPDVAMLFFYAGNDVVDNYYASLSGQEPGHKEDGRTMQKILGSSQIYQRILDLAASSKILRSLYGKWKVAGLWGETGRQLVIYQKAMEGKTQLWAPTLSALKDFVGFCREQGIEPVVVLLPARVQFDDRFWKSLSLRTDIYSPTHPNDILRLWLEEDLGIRLLDPLESFREASGSGADLCYPINGHWTPASHEILGNFLLHRVKDLYGLSRAEHGTSNNG